LQHFRGRSCYELVGQAAETHLRALEDAPQVNRLIFRETQRIGEDRWQVHFTDTQERAIWQLVVKISPSTNQAFQSCKGDKQAPSLAYELADYNILRGQPDPNPG
jgi:hypothetical protein